MAMSDPFDALIDNARRMGASPTAIEVDIDPINERQKIIGQLEGHLDGVELDDLDPEKKYGALLSFKDIQILLYIPDHKQWIGGALEDASKGNRYHVAHCKKLEEMRKSQKFSQYRATNSTTRDFSVHGVDDYGKELKGTATLYICKLCLNKINYQGYASEKSGAHRANVFAEFNREQFFSIYSSLFPYLPWNETAKASEYAADWKDVSRNYRSKKNYSCERCSVNLIDYKKLLHVHHINQNKLDNHDDNLQALCLECHRVQPGHEHMRVKTIERNTIKRLRCDSALNATDSWDDVFKLSDPAVHGVLFKLKSQGIPPPIPGYEVIGPTKEVVLEVELAWESTRSGVVLREADQVLGTELGWELKTVAGYLD